MEQHLWSLGVMAAAADLNPATLVVSRFESGRDYSENGAVAQLVAASLLQGESRRFEPVQPHSSMDRGLSRMVCRRLSYEQVA
jgi:hypothetical protein